MSSTVSEKSDLANGHGPKPESSTPTEIIPPKPASSGFSWRGYSELARVHKPAGILAFHVPLVLGSLVAVVVEFPPFDPLRAALFSLQLFLSSFFLRSAACAFNDAADWRFDCQVERCKSRPIPRGAVTPNGARIWALILTICWIATVYPTGHAALWTLVPNFAFNVAYPYMKRVTDYPQVFLGFMFSIQILTGYAMTSSSAKDLDILWIELQIPVVSQSLSWLVVANTAWTIFYDMIYAFQDIADDEKAGVRSIALRFKERGKAALGLLVALQILGLAMTGVALKAGTAYYVCCASAGLVSLSALYGVKLDNPESCGLWFKTILFRGGLNMCVMVSMEYFYKH